MHLSRPLWKQDFAGLLVRLPLGAFFIMAGRFKLADMNSFINTVKGFNILPAEISTLYAVLLPYMEILVGGLLIVGMFTTLAALLGSALLFSFIVALGLFPDDPALFNKDFILLGAMLSLLSSGAGSFSIDNFRTRG